MLEMFSKFVGGNISTAAKAAGIWYVLQVIGNWRILSKAGRPGWHCLVPFLNIWEEYDICWKGKYGLMYTVSGIAVGLITTFADPNVTTTLDHIASVLGMFMFLLNLIQSNKLARSFGRGIFFTFGLLAFNRVFRIILGLGASRYYGKTK